jgi:hypothetical protein
MFSLAAGLVVVVVDAVAVEEEEEEEEAEADTEEAEDEDEERFGADETTCNVFSNCLIAVCSSNPIEEASCVVFVSNSFCSFVV